MTIEERLHLLEKRNKRLTAALTVKDLRIQNYDGKTNLPMAMSPPSPKRHPTDRYRSFNSPGPAPSALLRWLCGTLPVYKLLGGKVRDKVGGYDGVIRFPRPGSEPQHYAETVAKIKERPEKLSIIKGGSPFTARWAIATTTIIMGS